MGVLYYPATANLKVDIGNSVDVLAYSPTNKERITAGVEFMAYAYSTSYKGYRLQIDAVDGFFGGNICYSFTAAPTLRHGARFRYIHNSAHLVDGHFDLGTEQWMRGKLPFPYTRDFAELTYFYEPSGIQFNSRLYAGGTYSVRKRPAELKRPGFLAGAEYYTTAGGITIGARPMRFFAAYHFTVNGVPKFSGSSHLTAGARAGVLNGKGVSLYLSYFSGNNMFNEYYFEKINRLGIGFTVDF